MKIKLLVKTILFLFLSIKKIFRQLFNVTELAKNKIELRGMVILY